MSERLIVRSPEHVLIALEPAGLGARTAALLVDLLAIAALISAAGWLFGHLPGGIGTAAQITSTFVILWGYPIVWEQLRAGQTLGKQSFRLRVVDVRGLPPELPQSLVRNLVRIVDLLPAGGIGIASCLFDVHRRRLGDLAAGTLVVREKPREDREALALRESRRHNSLATPRLRKLILRRLSLEERELLLDACLRAPLLDEAARLEMFEEMGDQYRREFGVDDARLSGENLVRGLVAVAFGA